MNFAGFRDASLGVALATTVDTLLGAISGVIQTANRFKPVLNHLNDTVSWITPRIEEISRSTDSQEIERLMNLLNQAKETVDKCSGVSFESLGLERIVQSQPAEIVNDIALWKRKKLSGSLLFTSTATWVLQQVYEYNFLTIASWLAIVIVTSLFS
ncbi:hypothetical protein CRYUN_Cryun22dG0101500 [Craigia yunnanensis]